MPVFENCRKKFDLFVKHKTHVAGGNHALTHLHASFENFMKSIPCFISTGSMFTEMGI